MCLYLHTEAQHSRAAARTQGHMDSSTLTFSQLVWSGMRNAPGAPNKRACRGRGFMTSIEACVLCSTSCGSKSSFSGALLGPVCVAAACPFAALHSTPQRSQARADRLALRISQHA